MADISRDMVERGTTLRGSAGWFFDVLMRGYVVDIYPQTWSEHYSTDELFDSYRAWSRDTKEAFSRK
jgi:hypothetical protein